MSEKLILPPALFPPKQQGWKTLALTGWGLALVLGWLHLQRMHTPALSSPPQTPVEAGPAPRPPAVEGVRALLQQHQPQAALAEIARIWTQCQNHKRLPPPELPELFAQAVRDLSQAPSTRPGPDRSFPPQPGGSQAPPPPPPPSRPRHPEPDHTQGYPEAYTRAFPQPCPGPLPGPGYPQAQPRGVRPQGFPADRQPPPWAPPQGYAPPPKGDFGPPPDPPGQPPTGNNWPSQGPGQPPPPPYDAEPYPAPPGGSRPPGY